MEELQPHYNIVKILGSGGFGKVVEAINSQGEHVAVKILSKREYKVAKILSEAVILERMKHPNIVEFKGVKETDTKLLIEMALVNYGPLKIRKYTLNEARTIMTTIFKAVEFIHSHNVVHRDLKPENILISDINDYSSLKIADFGLSAGQIILHGQCGTLIYMAPELFTQKVYSKPIDIWSCGIMLYQVITGKHPLYKGEKSNEYKKKLLNPQWEFPDDFDPIAKHLFLKCVAQEPIDRYNANQVLQHPWITNQINDSVPLTLPEMQRAFISKELLIQKIKVMIFLLNFSSITISTKYLNNYQQQKLINHQSNLFDKDYMKEMFKEQQAIKENQLNPHIQEKQLKYLTILQYRLKEQQIQDNIGKQNSIILYQKPTEILQSIQENGVQINRESKITEQCRTNYNEDSQPSSSEKSVESSPAQPEFEVKSFAINQTKNTNFKKRSFKKNHVSDKKRRTQFDIAVLRSRSTTANHKIEIKQSLIQQFESPKQQQQQCISNQLPIQTIRNFKSQITHSPTRKLSDYKTRVSNSSTKKIKAIDDSNEVFKFEQEKVIHSMFMPRVIKNKNALLFQRNMQQRYIVQPQYLELNVIRPPLPLPKMF